MILQFRKWMYVWAFHSSVTARWLNSHVRCVSLSFSLSDDEILEFPVQFTTPVSRASFHKASLCRVLHDGLSASPVPLWPCSPHRTSKPLPTQTSTSLLFASAQTEVITQQSQKMINVSVCVCDCYFVRSDEMSQSVSGLKNNIVATYLSITKIQSLPR